MELTDSFTLPVTAERLWDALTDVELIAPCIPGFQLEDRADPEYRGAMKIKVGAITVQYDATITFVERDDAAWRAVLSVDGKERRGTGTVNANVTATLSEQGEQTTAKMVTDVQVTGRVAQFGRGIISDVASRLTKQFVDCLDARVLAPPAEPESSAAAPASPRPVAEPADTAFDLGTTALGPVLKRVVPVAAVLLSVLFVLRRRLG